MEPFIGQVMMFAGNFAPRGWAMCDGQLLPISENQALFSLLGTNFGGDGRTTFGLPDFRGRSPMGIGSGPGLPPIREGQKVGQPTVSLTVNELPPHDHSVAGTIHVVAAAGTVRTPDGGFIAGDAGGDANYAPGTAAAGATLAAPSFTGTGGTTGGGQAVPTQSPVQGIVFVIALQGIFPSRN